MSFKGPDLAVNFLSDNFSGSPEGALVLDVACGSGWVTKVVRLLTSNSTCKVQYLEGFPPVKFKLKTNRGEHMDIGLVH